MQRIVKLFGSCLGLLFVGLVVFAVLVVWQSNKFWFAQGSGEVVSFEVEAGSGVSTIADDLKEQEIISSPFWFKVYTKLDGSARFLQAGVFEVTPGASYSRIVDVLIDAESDEVSLTIPEGLTVAQIGEIVTSEMNISQEEWDLWTGADSPLESHPFLSQKPADVGLEGYLFPDTYRFFADATVEDVVTRLVDEMQENYNSLNIVWPDIYPPVLQASTHDVITLASIIQREVLTASEMKTVSGIFHNRLNIGMALQADSTVNYITGKDTPAISLADRDIESPYNTYQNAGLPPGPISNPGLDALTAAAFPDQTDYFYFLTDPAGVVYYAVTFDQHVANKNAHLR